MRRFMTAAFPLVAAVTFVACSDMNPTAPSRLSSGGAPLTRLNTVVGSTGTTGSGNSSGSDQASFIYVANFHHTLVQLGTLAQARGDHRWVTNFALQLVGAHREWLDEVGGWGGDQAERNAQFLANGNQLYEGLRGQSGSAFDRMFVSELMGFLRTELATLSAIDGSNNTSLNIHGDHLAQTIATYLAQLRDIDSRL